MLHEFTLSLGIGAAVFLFVAAVGAAVVCLRFKREGEVSGD